MGCLFLPLLEINNALGSVKLKRINILETFLKTNDGYNKLNVTYGPVLKLSQKTRRKPTKNTEITQCKG